MIGKQSAIGVATTPSIAIPYLSDSFATEMEADELRSGGDNEYYIESVKMRHREAWGFECYARPRVSAYLLAYVMGNGVLTGTTDPYTHVFSRSERPYLTIERKLKTGQVQRLIDCKIENLELTGEAGNPLKFTVSGGALTAQLRTTDLSPTYESERPFSFYHGAGRFKYDTTADDNIKSFNIKWNVNSGGGLSTPEYLLAEFPDFNYSVEATMDFYSTGWTRWKQINYDSSTIPQPDIDTGSFELDMQYAATTTRQVKITIPKLAWKPVPMALSVSPDTMSETIAGLAQKLYTTEL